jgi:hypothetical protein
MTKNVKLLQEWTPLEYTIDTISESKHTNEGKIVLKGILQKADTLNQNGRIYPRAILEREVRNYQKFIKERRAIGELDHPSTSVVELKNGSHVITNAYMEGDVVYGTIEVLDKLPMGKILAGYIEHGIKVGISSRGVGSTQQRENHQIVNDDFQLICWDMVAEPSTPGAFMGEGKVLFDARGNPIVGYENDASNNKILSICESIINYRSK